MDEREIRSQRLETRETEADGGGGRRRKMCSRSSSHRRLSIAKERIGEGAGLGWINGKGVRCRRFEESCFWLVVVVVK